MADKLAANDLGQTNTPGDTSISHYASKGFYPFFDMPALNNSKLAQVRNLPDNPLIELSFSNDEERQCAFRDSFANHFNNSFSKMYSR